MPVCSSRTLVKQHFHGITKWKSYQVNLLKRGLQNASNKVYPVTAKITHFNYTKQLATPLWDDTQIVKMATAENSYCCTGREKCFQLEKPLQVTNGKGNLPFSSVTSFHIFHAVALRCQANFSTQCNFPLVHEREKINWDPRQQKCIHPRDFIGSKEVEISGILHISRYHRCTVILNVTCPKVALQEIYLHICSGPTTTSSHNLNRTTQVKHCFSLLLFG